MTVVLQSGASSQSGVSGRWTLGFSSLESERDEELPVQGEIPSGLKGTLYRIGPARHDVYGERYRHWFDGDGMVHAITIGAGHAHYRNRFVSTVKKRDEDLAGRRLYGAFGTVPSGRPLQRLRRALPKSAANTNVVLHSGKLLALWEAGRPWKLDPVSLETMGEDDLGGVLGPRQALSAHPKYDPGTGEMWNFGVDYGPRPTISIYCISKDGQNRRVAKLSMPFAAMVHDFAITETKVLIVFAPIGLPPIPVPLLAGRKSFGESLRWQPSKGTRVWVYDRHSGELRKHRTGAFMMFHTANAYDEGEEVVLDLCAYPDASVMRLFTEVMAGRSLAGVMPRLERLRIGEEGITRQRLSDAVMEFPRVASLCSSHGTVYGVGQRDGDEFLGVPLAVDTGTGKAIYGSTHPWQFAGELVPTRKAGATCDRDVWLLTLVLDAAKRTSELWVLDGNDIAAPPVATVALPHIVPFGFHGNWVRPAEGGSTAGPWFEGAGAS